MKRVTPSDAERRQFGDLAADIAYLRRGCHLTVARYQVDTFRIGDGAAVVVVYADGIRTRAEKERDHRAKQSEAMKRTWERPGFRAIQAAGRKARGRT